MPRKQWVVELKGQEHIVDLVVNPLNNSGKISVDGKVVKICQADIFWPEAMYGEHHFDIAGSPAVMSQMELYIEGKLI